MCAFLKTFYGKNDMEYLESKTRLLELIRSEEREKSEILMGEIVSSQLDSDMEKITDFFSEVHREVQADLFTKRLDLKRKTRYMLESLAFPYSGKSRDELVKIYGDIIGGNAYYRKKRPINFEKQGHA